MNSKTTGFFQSTAIYLLELTIFFLLAYLAVYPVDQSKAQFLAGFSLFLVLCACVIGRPAAPHFLLKLFARPTILLMFIVVVGFGAFGTREPDLTVFVPGFALALIGAAFADRVDKSRQKKNGHET
ncbi:hypothetical protein NDK50_33800 [Paraburkholderia bryophila]|uniref:hypothetical protein n=1 Tax=Paraburkholderia bryophila TaxID=420952 RepID=UPI00234B45B6|nr:hypothetical protein [Paraburkholderia bryophila]WCM22952.1 hypothetical protein NDK50_33800 [Paraburkholderia bryophila]